MLDAFLPCCKLRLLSHWIYKPAVPNTEQWYAQIWPTWRSVPTPNQEATSNIYEQIRRSKFWLVWSTLLCRSTSFCWASIALSRTSKTRETCHRLTTWSWFLLIDCRWYTCSGRTSHCNLDPWLLADRNGWYYQSYRWRGRLRASKIWMK